MKRLRLCVADNEAFRAALSLLRVREAEEGELVRMLGTCVWVYMGMCVRMCVWYRCKTTTFECVRRAGR